MPRDPRWLSATATAEVLGCDRTTLYRWRDAGRLTGIRTFQPGARVYYWRPDVEAWLKEHGAIMDDATNETKPSE